MSSPNSSRTWHPWPEWSRLVESLNAGGYIARAPSDDDAFVESKGLSDEFVRAAIACLGFGRNNPNALGSLSRKDIEVVVENGSPFLFTNGFDSVRRLRAFLAGGESNVMESEKARTVDLMRFLLSYASNPTDSSGRNDSYNRELVESSVRNLLNELAEMSCRVPASDLSGSVQKHFSDRYGQTPRPLGQNIEMKRGDWLCPRCSFMNFARNMKCLECEEARPKRQLTGGEWECPQCDFFNYGRNATCLRCDCKRPGEASFGSTNSRSGVGYGNGRFANKVDIDSRLADNEEKAERWFSKISQLDSTTDMNSAIGDEDFPEIMPLRKGVNRFVVSTRKTPLERRLANAQNRRNLGNDGTPEGDFQSGGSNKTIDTSVSKSLDEILGRSSAVSGVDNNSTTTAENAGSESRPPFSGSASSQYGRPKGNNSSYAPFVPLPADMFANKFENPKEDSEKAVANSSGSFAPEATDQLGPISGTSESNKYGDNLKLSEKPVSQAESKVEDKEQAEKSERWFKKVAELHDVTDLASAISDEDFPEIMPMRKGENRFVVSKKKDRSLTSPTYKRRLAMDQASKTNFVPFVPFPPDYFAKKDKQQPNEADSTQKVTGETSPTSAIPEKLSERLDDRMHDRDHMQPTENQTNSPGSWNFSSGENSRDRPTPSYSNPQTNTKDSWNSGYSGKDNTTNLNESSPGLPKNQNVRQGWTGKSLEGSAVKEPDPLDMSEEAKAERWFRRVAQIKDISELSQIPDEDFPSIMPMRKGVNRFVVSKRKTPLERRLTSPQYRRNLPVVSSEPVKKENESG